MVSIHFYLTDFFRSNLLKIQTNFISILCTLLFECLSTRYVVRCDVEFANQTDAKIICFHGDLKKCLQQYHDEQSVVDDYETMDYHRTKLENKKTIEMIHQMQCDGVKIVLCSGNIDEFCKQNMEESEIVAIGNVCLDILHRISDVTGASHALLSRLEFYKPSFIGKATQIVGENVFGSDFICITNSNKV